MTNEGNDEVIIDNNEEIEINFDEESSDQNQANLEVKPKRSPQEEYDYFQGRADRIAKKLGLNARQEAKPQEKVQSKSNEIDYGLEAFFVAKGIPEDDVDFVHETMKDTGKSAKELLTKGWFQAELKERQESRTVAQATPKGTKRSGSSARDTVEHHVQKYESGQMTLSEMPFDMRSKVLEAVTKKSDSNQTFNFD